MSDCPRCKITEDVADKLKLELAMPVGPNRLIDIDDKIYTIKEFTRSMDDELCTLQRCLRGMIESYDILLNESPLGKNSIASGVIRGAFIDVIGEARHLISSNHEEKA